MLSTSMQNLVIIKDYGLDIYKRDWDMIESMYDRLSAYGYNTLHSQLNKELERAKNHIIESRQIISHTVK